MSFSGLMAKVDGTILDLFGTAQDNVAVILFPQSGGSFSITGIVKPAPIEEEVVPGSASGASAVRFFVRPDTMNPSPQIGDQVSIGEVFYDVFDLQADNVGGAVLKLRRNG